MKKRLSSPFILVWLLFGSMAIVYFWQLLRGDTPAPQMPAENEVVHELLGTAETCVSCHGIPEGFAPAHRPEVIGCAPCHGGNPRAADSATAHQGIILVPGNWSTLAQTCGAANCHGDLTPRLQQSLMSSMAGIIAVDKFAFGEHPSLSGDFHIAELGAATPADLHLRHLCASCHLGAEKTQPGPVTESSRGGGCNACHIQYTQPLAGSVVQGIHPALTINVSNDHCFGCHSRSGRIATNYEGWHETTLTSGDIAGKAGYRTLADGRIFQQISPDVHHLAGLACIDCHHPLEIMGDGQRYQHQEEAIRIRCADCHFTGQAESIPYAKLDLDSKRLLALRQWAVTDSSRFLAGAQRQVAYYHIAVDQRGTPVFRSKNTGIIHPLKSPAQACSREGEHRDLSCSACHTGWAPQCVGCHNQFDQQLNAFDLLDRKTRPGKWVEYLGEFFAEPPSLGIVELDSTQMREIRAFIPGMIMTIDLAGFPGEGSRGTLFHRLFAPAAPHTTTAKGRSCQSCHTNPVALGYGRGKLQYQSGTQPGRWTFQPEYTTEADGLPQDAWIPFLGTPRVAVSTTRPNARPFTITEQQRILTVGACLSCHEGTSTVMQQGLKDFPTTLRARTPACIVPSWVK